MAQRGPVELVRAPALAQAVPYAYAAVAPQGALLLAAGVTPPRRGRRRERREAGRRGPTVGASGVPAGTSATGDGTRVHRSNPVAAEPRSVSVLT